MLVYRSVVHPVFIDFQNGTVGPFGGNEENLKNSWFHGFGGLVFLCPYAPMDGIFHLRIYRKNQRNVGIINICIYIYKYTCHIYMYHWMWVFDGIQ